MKLKSRRISVNAYPLSNPQYTWYFAEADTVDFLKDVEAGTAPVLGTTNEPELVFNIPNVQGEYQFALVVKDVGTGQRTSPYQPQGWKNVVLDFIPPVPISNFVIV